MSAPDYGELVRRLRWRGPKRDIFEIESDMVEAADAIEQQGRDLAAARRECDEARSSEAEYRQQKEDLQTELEIARRECSEMRAALEKIARKPIGAYDGARVREIARTALGGG